MRISDWSSDVCSSDLSFCCQSCSSVSVKAREKPTMADILLTFHCASHDADSVTDALRAACDAPIHIAEQAVRGWDFGDASTAERVSGLLRRSALELIVDEGALGALVGAVTQSKRSLRSEEHAVPGSARGGNVRE